MKPKLAVMGAITLYWIWLFFDILAHEGFSEPKALLGCVMAGLLFGRFTYLELKIVSNETKDEYSEEREWVNKSIHVGMDISEATRMLSLRFMAKPPEKGFSFAGKITVYDFESPVSDVRLLVRNDAITSIKITAPHPNDAVLRRKEGKRL